MNLLVTSSRFPVALDEIRKFGRHGHRIVAADTIRTAPGAFSRYASARAVVASPKFSTDRFIRDIKQLVFAWKIDLIVPCFEEVFYLAAHFPELSEVVPLFASDFTLLARLHDKAAFTRLADELGIRTPHSTVVYDAAELRGALAVHPRYYAKPVFSRGGIEALTNSGPLAGALDWEHVVPTGQRPWLVQEFIDGIDVCTFGVAQHGRLVAHCTYLHPRQIEHGGGIVFESIEDPETVACDEKIVSATGYHGQFGFDYRRNQRELVVIECNPRPTAGVHLMSDDALVDSVLGRLGPTIRVVPPGRRRMYASALVRDLLRHGRSFREDLEYLRSSGPDVYAEKGDRLPALLQVLSYSTVLAYFFRHGVASRPGATLMAAYLDGAAWDGQPIP